MAELDAMPEPAFLAALGDLFEHSPWVMTAVAAGRPYGTAQALHGAAMQVVAMAGEAAQLALIGAHPELAGREAADGALTPDSRGEQGRLGLDRLSAPEHAELTRLNAAYRARFGYVCIVALARHATRESVFAAIRARLDTAPAEERAAALREIGHVTEARLAARLAPP